MHPLQLVMAILSILCFIFAFRTFRKGHPFNILALLILNCGLLCLFYSGFITLMGVPFTPILFSHLLFPISILLFFQNLHTSSLNKYDKLLLLFPAGEILIYFSIAFVIYFSDENAIATSSFLKGFSKFIMQRFFSPELSSLQLLRTTVFLLFFYLQLLIFPVAVYFCWRTLKNAQQRHLNYFSNDTFRFYHWNFLFLIFILLCVLIIGGIEVSRLFYTVNVYVRILAYFLVGLAGLGFAWLSIYGQKHLEILNTSIEVITTSENKNSTPLDLKGTKYPALTASVRALFENDYIYRNPNLTLTEVAEQLEMSTRHLSRVINQELKVSFSELVNDYRVQEVKNHLVNTDYDHYSILSIGLEAGFSSKSTFYAVFKRKTGLQPLQYKQHLRSNDAG